MTADKREDFLKKFCYDKKIKTLYWMKPGWDTKAILKLSVKDMYSKITFNICIYIIL